MKIILVIDMQKGFINKNNEHLVNDINKFLKQKSFDKVIFTKYKNKENSPFVKFLNWNALTDEESQRFVVDGEAGMIEKYSYGLPFEEICKFKEKDIEEIYLCGTDLDACVLNIAFNLFDNNIKPIFIKELCATSSRDENMADYAWHIIERNFGRNCIKSKDDIN